MIKKIFVCFFALLTVIDSSAATITVNFGYDPTRQAISIDMEQFPLNLRTEVHFAFEYNKPDISDSVEGGTIHWVYSNFVNRADLGVFRGGFPSTPSYAWDSTLNTTNAVSGYEHYAVDPNNAIYGGVNNFRYFSDTWDYPSDSIIYFQPTDINLNPIPVTEDDFYNRFFYVAETFNGGLSPTEWLQPQVVPIPSAVWLFGSGLIGLIGVARRKANA